MSAHHLYGKSGYSGENSNGTADPNETFFGKKVRKVLPFPDFTKMTRIFCTICLDYQ